MINFSFHNPTEIIFGKDTVNEIPHKIPKSAKVLLHYGSGSIKRTGLYDKVTDLLNLSKIKYIELGGVKPNPRLSLIREGIKLCKEEKIDFILAVGGGSTIDSAKAIALGTVTDDDIWDFFAGNKLPTKTLPVGVILTIPAAGSESSDSLVVTDETQNLKWDLVSPLVRPRFAILDPKLTLTLSPYQTVCGISDMLAHIMERYFTTVKHVDVTDHLCEGLMRSIIHNAKLLIKDLKNYDLRAEIMWAGTIAHCDILGTGRIGDWASHHIEHELSAEYDIAHGAGLSIIFPAWMKYNKTVDPLRFSRFAQKVWGVDASRENDINAIINQGILQLENFYKELGLPTRLNDIGISNEKFTLMAHRVRHHGNFKKLSACDIEKIYALASKSS